MNSSPTTCPPASSASPSSCKPQAPPLDPRGRSPAAPEILSDSDGHGTGHTEAVHVSRARGGGRVTEQGGRVDFRRDEGSPELTKHFFLLHQFFRENIPCSFLPKTWAVNSFGERGGYSSSPCVGRSRMTKGLPWHPDNAGAEHFGFFTDHAGIACTKPSEAP